MRDLNELFAALARSRFRRRFGLGRREAKYLASRGLETVLAHGERFIAQRLAPAEPANDGRQTPWRNHPVFVAQHATATCCRRCLSRWHHIPAGAALSVGEQRMACAGRQPTGAFMIFTSFLLPRPTISGLRQPTSSSQKRSSSSAAITSGRWPSCEYITPPGSSSG